MPALEIFANWADIIALLVVIIIFFVDLYRDRRTKEKSTLTYIPYSISSPIIIGAGKTIENNIKIHYKRKNIENLNVMQVRLKNTSSKPILKSQVVEPITFRFAPGVELLNLPQTIEKKPDDLSFSWYFDRGTKQSPSLNVVSLDFELLNKNEELRVEFVWTGEKTEPKVTARIVGIQIERVEPEQMVSRQIYASLRRALRRAFVWFILIAIALSLVAALFALPDIYVGFSTGFIFATILGYILGEIQRARSLAGTP